MTWPKDVGIIAMEVYFPSQYVDQVELEEYDKVSTGKYTIGLGQAKMGFCSDREDINSLCLTVVNNLIKNNKIPPEKIGRLEVGTETIIDKSKSVKTVLMQLLSENNKGEIKEDDDILWGDVEGVDCKNACYGGTAALFNAINWIESSYWDGRYALVVCGDIAVYASGNARPTGGAGAVAMLLGSDAPLVFDQGLRSSYMGHAYDFYKPNLLSEFPVVDGKLSVKCYLNALDQCYKGYKTKHTKYNGGEVSFDLNHADAFLFHSPYCKLVQKSLARLALNDFISSTDSSYLNHSSLASYKNARLDNSYFDKDIEKAFMEASAKVFNQKTKPHLLLSNQIGNLYTPSLYGALTAFIHNQEKAEDLLNKKIVLFSYGSGFASSMFSVTFQPRLSETMIALFHSMRHITTSLNRRSKVSPAEFEEMMTLREKTHHLAPYKPQCSTRDLFPGTFYLEYVDDHHRRTYKQKGPH